MSIARSALDPGSVSGGLYRNNSLGLSCKIPSGWVLRTEEMDLRDEDQLGPTDQQGAPAKSSAEPKAGDKPKDASDGRVLLAAFSRPPDARAEDVKSSILIAAESVASYPGLKAAAQYFGPLSEVAKARGFQVVNEPYDFLAGTKMVVRGDFQKDVGTRVMRQSTLVMLVRGYAVSFTFIGGTEEEVEELIQGLGLAAARTTR